MSKIIPGSLRIPLRIELQGLPPLISNAFGRTRSGITYKKKDIRQWEQLAEIKIKTAARMLYGTHDLSKYRGFPVCLEIIVYRDSWRAKAGPRKGLYVRPDLSNFIKILEDALFKSLNLDDSAVVELTAVKQEMPGHPKTIIVFEFSPEILEDL